MKNTLAEIVSNKRSEVDTRKNGVSQSTLSAMVTPAKGTFIPALQQSGINLITEIKPKSPSAGELRSELDVIQVSKLYAQYASAISVLTDNKYFGGSLSLLEQVAQTVATPVLCKDFFIDAYQVFEARKAGAEAVLLIVKILDDAQLRSLHALTHELNMTAVVEVQTEAELNRALAIYPKVILINNRDLSSFEIDLRTTAKLTARIPRCVYAISASGIEIRSDIENLSQYTNNFLIGSSLMRAPDLEVKLRELKGASAKLTAGDSTCRA